MIAKEVEGATTFEMSSSRRLSIVVVNRTVDAVLSGELTDTLLWQTREIVKATRGGELVEIAVYVHLVVSVEVRFERRPERQNSEQFRCAATMEDSWSMSVSIDCLSARGSIRKPLLTISLSLTEEYAPCSTLVKGPCRIGGKG